MKPKAILVTISIVLAALSYAWAPLMQASIIILGAAHFVPETP